jgi:glyoxylase-like metal-dependent hydrolase (beta-lactamase superfamily II)
MKITQHGQYLYQLTRLGAFNCYLLREEDGLSLIDTGLFGSAKGILQAADRLRLPIRRIILTHSHSDHVGSLDALRSYLPEAEVLASTRAARYLAGDRSLDPEEPQVKSRGSHQQTRTQPTHTFSEGDTVGSLQVIFAPGHSPDNTAFLDTRDRTLIAGDAFVVTGGLAVSGVLRWWFPFPGMATWHKPTALASAKKLRALQPVRLAVGHGAVLERPLAAMDQAIREAERVFGK